MINREKIIKFIPKPKNEDVIIYDVSLKDLLDVDVIQEYNNILPTYLSKKQEYLELTAKIESNNNAINNIYLYNTSWSEEDYLYKLKNDKKTYSIVYHDIKKIENTIEMLKKKINVMNEKIQIQTSKDKKAEEGKKKKRTSLKSILGGDILATDFFRRQTKLLVLIMVFIIFYIHNRYASQQQQIEIDRLKKELIDIKYDALTRSSELMEKSRQSRIEEYISNKESDLQTSTNPPYLIK